MRFRSVTGVAMALLLLAEMPAASPAQEQEKQRTENLPLRRVVLFNAGVGFFEHVGQVRGNAEAEFRFKVEGINDLLKSMVVQDLGGGQISTVSYGSKDPISKTLGSFAIDLTENPTLAELLNQIRGERVELEAPQQVSGMIVGVETKKRKAGDDEIIEVDVLNVLTEAGLQSLPLDTVSRIRLLDEKLDAEFRKALALLASAHATDKKTVTLGFRGEGEREVRVGYIQETPVWKTSYRLVLDREKPPLLQGWAIVENTTEDDWADVDLTLVSGRPISFVMDLYEPLYVPRPEEQLELYASLRPQRYEQDMAAREERLLREAEKMAVAQLATEQPEQPSAPAAAEAARGRRLGFGLAAAAADRQAGKKMDFGRGLQAVAAAAEVGELFRYDIAMPVTLPRQQSAMLPIVNQEVKGTKLSIYNSAVHAKHPLNGLRLTNSTELHLMQGPITVFDDGVYAGDAMINDLPPGSERLVSYAMDLNIEVATESKSQPDQIVSLRLVKGTVLVTRKYHRAVQYTVKNSGDEVKTVLIEQPVVPDWAIVQPKEPAEKTRDHYRFAVEAKPGDPVGLTVEEERVERQQLALTNLDDNAIQMYVGAPAVSEEAKKALSEVAKRRSEIVQTAAQRQQLEQQIQSITQEQTRIRENMGQLDRTSELYKRYVKKFSEQEDQIEQLRTKIDGLSAKENELRRALDEYLMGLDVQ